MLSKIKGHDYNGAVTTVGKAYFPEPFKAGLEYNPPARGHWNIVHTGMLMPQSHQVFACAQGCLRGVILTAGEMNAIHRMSWVSVEDDDIIAGSMEQDVIDGVISCVEKMIDKPRCVLVFLSCVQFYAGCDFNLIIDTLKNHFPDIYFVDCYMSPTMRKSGMAPEILMRKQLYAPLKMDKKISRQISIIGNDFATDESCELIKILRANGYDIKDIARCKSYDEYLSMGNSFLNITHKPTAVEAGNELQSRLGQQHFYMPASFDYYEISALYRKLFEYLDMDYPNLDKEISKCENKLDNLKKLVSDTEIVIDYTAVTRPLGLACLLLKHGFNVTTVYADFFSEEERQQFDWLRFNKPDLKLMATVNPQIRYLHKDMENSRVIAIGQECAYFHSTAHFVNYVYNNGHYGFDGICRLCDEIADAFKYEKDTRKLISHKGLGCESCI